MKHGLIDRVNPELHDPTTRNGVFREVARDIVWEDRDSRKFGASPDTGGSITRALELAYRLGLAHATEGGMSDLPKLRGENLPISWTSLPFRPREAFDSIVRFAWTVVLHPNPKPVAARPYVWACYLNFGKRRHAKARVGLAGTYAISTLRPMVKIGLMEESVMNGVTCLILTAKGLETWELGVRAGHIPPKRKSRHVEAL